MFNFQSVSGLITLDTKYRGPGSPRLVVTPLEGAPYFVHEVNAAILEAIVGGSPLGELHFLRPYGAVENQSFSVVAGLTRFERWDDAKLAALESTPAPKVEVATQATETVEQVRARKQAARTARKADREIRNQAGKPSESAV